MDGLPEVAVVEAARAGDQRAMDELVGGSLPLVYNIVGRALDDRGDVDDVVQETMLRVTRGIGGLRDPAKFRSWLVAVTMSQVREHRRAGRDAPGTDPLDVTIELADPGADFVDLTITQLGLTGQRREVAEATRWLDPDDRHLLSLWWLETAGVLARAELVDALDLDAHHVTVRVQRMKAQLETARMVVRSLAAVPRCPELADTAATWRGRPEPVWRKRFARHVRECGRCAQRSADLVPVERLLAGITLVPVPAYLTVRPPAAADGPGMHRIPGRHIRGRRAKSHGPGHLIGRLAAKPLMSAAAVATTAGIGVAAAYAIALRPQAPVTLSLTPVSPSSTAAVTTTGTTPPPASATTTTTTVPTTTTTAALPTTAARTPTITPSTTTTTATSPVLVEPPVSTTTGASSLDAAEQVLTVVNQARTSAGLPPYTLSPGLDQSAGGHNQLMANGCGLQHQCPGEPSLGARETAAGVNWTSCGENIGDGGPVVDSDNAIAAMAVSLTNDMLAEQPPDDGHRQNLLSSTFQHIGIAVYRDSSGTIWMTQDFSN